MRNIRKILHYLACSLMGVGLVLTLACAPRFMGVDEVVTASMLDAGNACSYNANEISSWSFVDNGGSNGLNHNPGQGAYWPTGISFNHHLFLTWSEPDIATGTYLSQYVSYYNDNDSSPGWTSLDSGNGVNVAARHGVGGVFEVFDSKLYLAWDETGADGLTHNQVKVFNGDLSSPGWTNVGGMTFNVDATQNSSGIQLTTFNNKLYAIWSEEDAISGVPLIRVRVYQGDDSTPVWTSVDGGGLNNNAANDALHGHLVAASGKLYAVFTEDDGIRVKVYNGDDTAPSWSSVDGGVNINVDPVAGTASQSMPVVHNSKIYLVWNEDATVRIKVYNGNDGAPAWSSVDGNGSGLGFDVAFFRYWPELISFNSKLYATWSEQTLGGIEQVRIAVYNNDDSSPSWSFVDGNGALGLNKNTGNTASSLYVFDLVEHQCKLYAFWPEEVGGFKNIMGSVGR